MIEAVFISDLHLHPERPDIEQRYDRFIAWALSASVQTIYILGDFFHAWPGDDLQDNWCKEIAKKTQILKNNNIMLYYMHGNRDFLLGRQFSSQAGWKLIYEPYVTLLGENKVLLMHGDSFCSLDKAHQRFRKLTRNRWFPWFFLKLPKAWRLKMVAKVRQKSMGSQKTSDMMDVVEEDVLSLMEQMHTPLLVHGHTHRPGVHNYERNQQQRRRYVLSDWDDKPKILCYSVPKGFYFDQY